MERYVDWGQFWGEVEGLGGVKRAEIFRQAVKLLINIRLQQVKHAAGRKFMRFFPVIHKPVNAILNVSAGEFGRGGFMAQRPTQPVAAQLGKGITEDQIIQGELMSGGQT